MVGVRCTQDPHALGPPPRRRRLPPSSLSLPRCSCSCWLHAMLCSFGPFMLGISFTASQSAAVLQCPSISCSVHQCPSISLKAAVSHQLQHAACRLAMQWAWFEWSQCPVSCVMSWSCVPLLRVFRSTFFQFFQGTVGERMKMRCNPSDEGLTINHPTVNKDFIIKVIKCHV
jgi:hypothetical protein